MNKKQVGAFLKVMGKDTMRPVLKNAKVIMYEDEPCLVATDGYILSLVKLGETKPELIDRVIRRDAIERWYKLATAKDRLNGETLEGVLNDDYAQHGMYSTIEYPDVIKVIPTTKPEGQSLMKFNANYLKIVQDLNGEEGLLVELHGEISPMVIKSEVATSVVMPIKQ